MLFGVGLVTDGTSVLRVPDRGEVAALGYLSIIVTVGAFILWYDALGRIGADRAGLFAGLIPVSAVLTTMVLGLRTPDMAELAGALLVGLGVVVGLRRSAGGPLAVAAPAYEDDPADDERGDDDETDQDHHHEDGGVIVKNAGDQRVR
jgi:drug/metabolite transporter (DMT)-like permease